MINFPSRFYTRLGTGECQLRQDIGGLKLQAICPFSLFLMLCLYYRLKACHCHVYQIIPLFHFQIIPFLSRNLGRPNTCVDYLTACSLAWRFQSSHLIVHKLFFSLLLLCQFLLLLTGSFALTFNCDGKRIVSSHLSNWYVEERVNIFVSLGQEILVFVS